MSSFKSIASALALSLLIFAPHLTAEEGAIPVIDLHVDLPYQYGYKGATFAAGSGQVRASDLRRAGLSGVVLPLFIPKDARPGGRDLGQFRASYSRVFGALFDTEPYALPGCGTGRRGVQGSVETWLAFEGADPIEPNETEIKSWVLRGVRVFGLVHTEGNSLGGSSGDPTRSGGLSERGARFAKIVWSAGGIIDVSHASDRTADDLLALARHHRGMVVATHSNARALAPHPRNLTDKQITAVGELGGVIGVNFHGRFLSPKSGLGTLDDVVAQVKYIAKLAGTGAVAIGSDFEGGIRPPAELKDALGYQVLADRLMRDGISRSDALLFMSGNARRVLCPRGDDLSASHAR